jgi:hypothetical protein
MSPDSNYITFRHHLIAIITVFIFDDCHKFLIKIEIREIKLKELKLVLHSPRQPSSPLSCGMILTKQSSDAGTTLFFIHVPSHLTV